MSLAPAPLRTTLQSPFEHLAPTAHFNDLGLTSTAAVTSSFTLYAADTPSPSSPITFSASFTELWDK